MQRSRLQLTVVECLDRVLSPAVRVRCLEQALAGLGRDDLPADRELQDFVLGPLKQAILALTDEVHASAVLDDLQPILRRASQPNMQAAGLAPPPSTARKTRPRRHSVADADAVVEEVRGHTLRPEAPRRPSGEMPAIESLAPPPPGARIRSRTASGDQRNWQLEQVRSARMHRAQVLVVTGNVATTQTLADSLNGIADVRVVPDLYSVLTHLDLSEMASVAVVYDGRTAPLDARHAAMTLSRFPQGTRLLLWGQNTTEGRHQALEHAGHLEWITCGADAMPNDIATVLRLMLS